MFQDVLCQHSFALCGPLHRGKKAWSSDALATSSFSSIFFSLFVLFPEDTDDHSPTPKNYSVTVRRIPAGGVKATSRASVMGVAIKHYILC